MRIKGVNTEKNAIKTKVESSYDPDTVRIINAPETLTEPGEWIVDSSARKIYHIASNGRRPDHSIVAPGLHELLFIGGSMESPVRNITIDGISFQHTLRKEWRQNEKCIQHDWESVDTANAIIRFRNAEDCTIKNSSICMGGSAGVRMDQLARRNRIENCEISGLGGNGIILGGLYFDTRDVNKGNIIRNNHIYNTGLIKFDGCGIIIAQSGSNQILNNLVHDTGYSGIVLTGILNLSFGWTGRELGRLISEEFLEQVGLTRSTREWNRINPYLYTADNLVERNEIFHTALRCGDGNPIYLRGAGTGNIVRENFVHHAVHDHGGIRMHDGQRGTAVERNVVYISTYSGIQIKGANRIINNIIIDTLSGNDPLNKINIGKWRNVKNYGSLHYRINIPIHNLGQPPVGSSEIRHNIFLNTRKNKSNLLQFQKRPDPLPADPELNAMYIAKDIERNGGVFTKNLFWDTYDPERAKAYVIPGNLAGDPMLIQPDGGDFSFPLDSPAAEMGIVPIDVSVMGLLLDEFPAHLQKRLPVRLGSLPGFRENK